METGRPAPVAAFAACRTIPLSTCLAQNGIASAKAIGGLDTTGERGVGTMREKLSLRLTVGVLLACLLASCATAGSMPPAATPPPPAGLATSVEATPHPVPLPLSQPGPYRVGQCEFTKHDASREGREVGVRVWYPALWPEGTSGKRAVRDADPDRSGAPYPLILSSAKMGSTLALDLVTHGFVWAGVTRIDTWDLYDAELIEQPLDILFALDQVASDPPDELKGMIDAEHCGAIGYSFDGYNALAMSGARVTPEFYRAQCADADATA